MSHHSFPGALPLSTLPSSAGIGLRAAHYAEVLAATPALGWVEVHSENFFFQGGAALHTLSAVRQHYPVSLHGVGLNLGSADALRPDHLSKLAALVERIEPAAISEHLCWSGVGGHYLNDLLPLPYTRQALETVCRHVDQVQEALRRPILVENISSYLQFADAHMSEWAFIAELVKRSGCGILLDVNNLYVSACNHGFDPLVFIDALPAQAVAEIHLAGYEMVDDFLFDSHSRPVHEPVWQLYQQTLARLGPRPTLIEWDNQIPALEVLLAEKDRAQAYLDACPVKAGNEQEVRHALAA